MEIKITASEVQQDAGRQTNPRLVDFYYTVLMPQWREQLSSICNVGGYELGLDYAIISGPRDGNGSNHNYAKSVIIIVKHFITWIQQL